MSKYIHKALLLYRVIISLLFVFGYGLKKLKMLINGEDFFYSFLGFGSDITLLLASIGELIAPIFIIIGYKTRFFTALPLFMMFIVVFDVKSGEPFESYQTALLYLISLSIIIIAGPGKYSIDNYIKGK
ncbi:MAG TPA: DoxX family protein [Flavobacteriaceae bacterium]|jgi:putative oxidoreductase|nr:DoxX family protein [Flavobacteriaceae bacterium]MDP7183928.1 DoxX family protein [Flavobacteriaceae bacterium]HJO70552.1 DoxX family protein [Flavobacteriaceae bacterium]|tara:strand:+ start:383 stop:769 length:387 start_codon:yes stop_codon:yes gene_type:complete